MDKRTRDILEALPPPAVRSRLAPHGDLILEMRRMGRTFREILSVLEEKCGVKLSISTLHDFVKQEGRKRKQVPPNRRHVACHPRPSSQPAPAAPTLIAGDEIQSGSIQPDVLKRIEALKQRPSSPENKTAVFDYDPDQPLQLPPKK
jgi:hypothetical protein